MRRGRLGLLLLTGLLTLAMTQPGVAARVAVKPSTASTERDCRAGVGSACRGSAVALKSGVLSVDTSLISPLDGAAPGQGFNADLARVRASFTLKKAVRSLPVAATIRLDGASAKHTGALFTAQPESAATGFAGVYVNMLVSNFRCAPEPNGEGFSCSGVEWFSSRRLVDATGPTTLGRQTLTFKTVLRPMGFSFGGPPPKVITPGRINVEIWMTARTRLGGCAHPACAAPEPVGCATAPGCVNDVVFPDGCVDPSCAARIPHQCVDIACTDTFPPAGCLDPNCTAYFPPGGCVDPDCEVFFSPYGCLDPFCAVDYPYGFWCAVDVRCASGDDPPAGVRQELADTGTVRASAKGTVTGIWFG